MKESSVEISPEACFYKRASQVCPWQSVEFDSPETVALVLIFTQVAETRSPLPDFLGALKSPSFNIKK